MSVVLCVCMCVYAVSVSMFVCVNILLWVYYSMHYSLAIQGKIAIYRNSTMEKNVRHNYKNGTKRIEDKLQLQQLVGCRGAC